MIRSDKLKEFEDNWVTEMGAWFGGDRVIFRGKNLFTEFHTKTWMDIWLYAITGKEFSSKQLELWNQLWILCSSFPEPRIWNNRVAALTGSARGTAAQGISASIAVSEAAIFGRQADIAAYQFIRKALTQIKDGASLAQVVDDEIKEKRHIPPGFGRPMISVDERIPPVIKLAEKLGFDQGEHYKLALQLDELLITSRRRLRLNIGGLAAALSADQGLTPREYYHFVLLTFTAGNIACYQDTLDKPEGSFFPLSCPRISYQGKPHRKWENPENRLD